MPGSDDYDYDPETSYPRQPQPPPGHNQSGNEGYDQNGQAWGSWEERQRYEERLRWEERQRAEERRRQESGSQYGSGSGREESGARQESQDRYGENGYPSSYKVYPAPGYNAQKNCTGSGCCYPKCFAEKGSRVSCVLVFVDNFMENSTSVSSFIAVSIDFRARQE